MDIRPIDDDDVIDLEQLPPNLTLRIETDPPVVGSVSFHIDGTFIRTESIAPYSISSDDGRGDFAPWNLTLGAHTIRATPFSAANAAGREGEALELDFTLVRGAIGTDAGEPAASVDAGFDAGFDAGSQAELRDARAAEAAVPTKKADAKVRESADSPEEAERSRDGSGCAVERAREGATDTGRQWLPIMLGFALLLRRRLRSSRTRARA